MKIDILAAGHLKNDPLKDIFDYYHKRIPWTITLQEISWDNPLKAEHTILHYKKSFPSSLFIALDEKGKNISSIELSETLHTFQCQGNSRITFLIGGADGFLPTMLPPSTLKIAFGRVTWPHLMVRILLIEQIYRSHQILQNHPYHRE
jgi:23S rRNA (pseudouridine1915-N3)-methyltransferase